MTRLLVRTAVLALVGLLVLLAVVLRAPALARSAVRGYLLVCAGLGAMVLVAWARWRSRPDDPLGRGWRHPRPQPVPEALGERRAIVDALRFAQASAVACHDQLRPLLREIADRRLRAVGHRLDQDPAAASILGPVAWDLLRPDRAAPPRGRARGPQLAELAAVVDAIDRIGEGPAGTPA